ncbi:NEL-type E3 ubiquitin ligase domain-containing protein [Pseudomonas putida]|uniref:RING-type E3 ubiquitin transferase n=1 Tax=Pseudomonas putida TaxID=303 RepID=A0A6I6XKN5_PSEPU|nr:NEL-type E3 ubiquitin ligase domain-containing protein [Pseudomonas putida]QHG64404.2 hypothetical protein C2H86_08275 [Pseudomonas putida]
MTASISPGFSLQDQLISKQLPTWLRGATSAQLAALNTSLATQMQAQQAVQQLYASVTSLDDFAGPLLEQQLSDLHQVTVDVRKARIHFEVVLPGAVAAVLGKPTRQIFEHSLLQAALHNFTADEAASMPGARLLDPDGAPIALAPAAFAALCRALDLGKRYQQYLAQQLKAPGQAVDHLIEQGYRSTLEAELRLADLKGEIARGTLSGFLPIISPSTIQDATGRDASEEVRLVARSWRVLGKEVRGAMAFEVRRSGRSDAPLEGVVCWIPGDEQGAVTWYENWQSLFATLGKLFRLPGYAEFFQRFIGERDRIAFSRALGKASTSRAAYEAVELDGRPGPQVAEPFQHMCKVQIDTLFENALELAPPTADKDSMERDLRLHFYVDAGLSALGLASLLVPWLGLPLLAVAAYEVMDGVYEGWADWQLGDRQAALEHLLGVAESVALVGVGVGVGVAGQRLLKSASVVKQLIPVPINESQLRLIHPELPGYDVLDDSLSVGERRGEPGQEYLRTAGGTYRVTQDPLTQALSIQHPTRSSAYSPSLIHNGAGGWRHEFEAPQQWQGESLLFRRLSSELDEVPHEALHDVLLATGFDEARLRWLHLENMPAPARLLDALQRQQLHQQEPALQGQAFETRLRQQSDEPTPAQRVLMNAFPGLTGRGAGEIVGRADPNVVQSMIERQKVPMALAGEARWFLRDSRVDRACAGLRQTAAVNADTERLAIGLLADAAPWPQGVRLELHDSEGRVVARAGADSARQVRVIVREGATYRSFDSTGSLLTNDALGDTLYKALLVQMDGQQKGGLQGAGQSPAQLADWLSQRAFSQRDIAAQLIGLPPLPRGLKPPVKQGDGRLGYPLSGGTHNQLAGEDLPSQIEGDEAHPGSLEQGLRQLFPTRDEATLQGYLRALGGHQAHDPWPAYRELVIQVRALRRSLSLWRGLDEQRSRVAQEIFEAWQPELSGETPAFALDLDGQTPGGLPDLPDAVGWSRLTRLTLRNIDLAQFDARLASRLGGVRHLSLIDSGITTVPDWLLTLDQLRELSLRNNRLSSLPEALSRLSRLTQLDLAHNQLTTVPEVLGRLSQIRVLNLENNRIVVDALGRTRLARLYRLQVLVLSHNPPSDLRSLPNNVALERVSLRFAGLTEFPVALFRQHPAMHLTLEGNQIAELSDEAVRAVRRHGAQINLDYNPLSEGTLARMAAPEAGLPVPQIRQRTYAIGGPAEGGIWLNGLQGDALAQRQAQWQRLVAEPDALPLRDFLNDLARSREFFRHPERIRARVWALLDACELDEQLRQVVFAEADTGPTCADQRLLLLNMLEIRVMVTQRLAGVAASESQAAYLEIGRGLYRLDQVNRVAFEHLRRLEEQGVEHDDVEVIMAYRQDLAEPLALPMQADQMHYRQVAQVSAADIQSALTQVLAGEDVESLSESLMSRDFWQAYLWAQYPQQFNALDEEFAGRMDALADQDDADFAQQAGALAAERNARLSQLFLTLTRAAYQRGMPH